MAKSSEVWAHVLAGVAFVSIGLWIFVWDVGMIRKSQASRSWPRVVGTVTSSYVDRSEREVRPHVTYDYTVDDAKFNSHRISFDLFDRDGGKGHAETIVTRYPVGTKIDVYVDPTNPAIAILEPEVYSPFYAPLLFASLFVVLGGWFAVSGVMTAIAPALEEPGTEKKDFKPLAALGMSILFYAILVSVLLEDKAQETTEKAFGKVVFGLPSTMGVILAITVLYLPMPYVFWHALQISFQAHEDKKPLGLEYLKDIRDEHPHLVWSKNVAFMGFLYFVAICVIWIVYAAKVGV